MRLYILEQIKLVPTVVPITSSFLKPQKKTDFLVISKTQNNNNNSD